MMGLQRLSKDYDIVFFSSRQLMFLISESSNPDIHGLLNLDNCDGVCMKMKRTMCHIYLQKKNTDDFLLVIFILGSKGGRCLVFRNLTVIDIDREPNIHSLCFLLTIVSY